MLCQWEPGGDRGSWGVDSGVSLLCGKACLLQVGAEGERLLRRGAGGGATRAARPPGEGNTALPENWGRGRLRGRLPLPRTQPPQDRAWGPRVMRLLVVQMSLC